MTDLETTIDTYLEAYTESDAARRDELVSKVWITDGKLIDPPFDAHGHDAISAMADAVLGHYPGHTFRRTSGIDAHHGFARYGWALVAQDGSVAVAGVDVAEVTDDGKLARVTGFFGDLPERES
jgi:hypothetical protein